MATDHTIKNFTSRDIEKYHQGLLSFKERHDLEKAALDDPFLADALEGFSVTGIDTAADIAELKKRLASKTEETKVIPIKGSGSPYTKWLRIAALFVFVAGAGMIVYKFSSRSSGNSIAKTEVLTNGAGKPIQPVTTEKTADAVAADSMKDAVAVTTTGKASQSGPSGTITGNKTNDVKNSLKTTEQKDEAVHEISSGGSVRRDLAAEEITKVKPTVVTEANAPGVKDKVTVQPDPKGENAEREALARQANQHKADADDMKIIPVNPAKKKQVNDVAVTTNKNYNVTANGYQSVPANQAEQNNNRGLVNNRSADQNQNLQNQFNTYRGRVTDNNNVGLPFARVTNSDDNNAGTYTDAQGNFNLTYPDSVLNLQIRSVGFENTNIQLKNTPALSRVVLQEDRSMNEVVISNKKPNAEARARGNNQQMEEPEPADGWENYDTYLVNNLNVPDEFRNKPAKTNEVEVSFEVDKYGNPVNIKVEKSLCKSCDKEAVRLIKDGPKWKQHAKKGRTRVTIPFYNNQ